MIEGVLIGLFVSAALLTMVFIADNSPARGIQNAWKRQELLARRTTGSDQEKLREAIPIARRNVDRGVIRRVRSKEQGRKASPAIQGNPDSLAADGVLDTKISPMQDQVFVGTPEEKREMNWERVRELQSRRACELTILRRKNVREQYERGMLSEEEYRFALGEGRGSDSSDGTNAPDPFAGQAGTKDGLATSEPSPLALYPKIGPLKNWFDQALANGNFAAAIDTLRNLRDQFPGSELTLDAEDKMRDYMMGQSTPALLSHLQSRDFEMILTWTGDAISDRHAFSAERLLNLAIALGEGDERALSRVREQEMKLAHLHGGSLEYVRTLEKNKHFFQAWRYGRDILSTLWGRDKVELKERMDRYELDRFLAAYASPAQHPLTALARKQELEKELAKAVAALHGNRLPRSIKHLKNVVLLEKKGVFANAAIAIWQSLVSAGSQQIRDAQQQAAGEDMLFAVDLLENIQIDFAWSWVGRDARRLHRDYKDTIDYKAQKRNDLANGSPRDFTEDYLILAKQSELVGNQLVAFLLYRQILAKDTHTPGYLRAVRGAAASRSLFRDLNRNALSFALPEDKKSRQRAQK